jgi:hypothetical protein
MPPCVLTAGYAGPVSDPDFNKRQWVNPYETTLSPSSLPSSTTGQFFEVDDSQSQLPPNIGATSNPIMAQPLYVTGVAAQSPANTNNCNNGTTCTLMIAVTLNGTVFAWNPGAPVGSSLVWSRQGTSNSNTYGGNALWSDDCAGGGTGASPVTFKTGSPIQFAGVLSTPAIDASGSKPFMFLTSYCQATNGAARWFFHEIDLTTGLDVAVNNIGNGGTWCASSFARPTVVNWSIFVPTYAVSTTGKQFSSCPTPQTQGIPYNSGVLMYQ